MNSVLTKLNNLWHNRVVANAKWMIAEQAVQMLVSFIIGMITARYLGPSNYGVINYCYAYVSFFTAIAGLGIEAIVVKELIAHPDSRRALIIFTRPSIWLEYNADGMSDFICTISAQVFIRNGKFQKDSGAGKCVCH